MEWIRQLDCNTRDLRLAIEEGMRPMQTFFDPERDRLPYFSNRMDIGPEFGNGHHSSFSTAHIPGRWLCALLSAEAAIGVSPCPAAISALRDLSLIHISFSQLKHFLQGKSPRGQGAHGAAGKEAAQPFTLPAVSPSIKVFCIKR